MRRILFAAALLAAPVAAQAQPVAVTLTEFKIAMARDTVSAGPVTFKIKNAGTTTHSFYVMGGKIDKGSADIPAGQEASLTLTLTPGTYEVFCPMSDETHKKAGMTHHLVVTAAKPAAPPKKP